MDFGSLYDDSEIDDDEEEFLFQSIQRYNMLQMFNLENEPYHLLPINDSTVCLVSKRSKGNNSEILKLRIPTKLCLPPEEDGRSKDNDFKVISGIHTESFVHRIGKISKENKIITSESLISGLQIYPLTDSSLGSKNEAQKLNVTQWSGFEFEVIEESVQVICSKCHHQPLLQIDVNSGEKINDIKNPFHNHLEGKTDPCDANNIHCKALSPNTLAVLNAKNGDIIFLDLRSNNYFGSLHGRSENQGTEVWTFSGCDFSESSFNHVGIVSDMKSFCIYDKRNNDVIIQHCGSAPPSKPHRKMKLKFNESQTKFSISGMDSLVEVYRVNQNNFDHIFTHNGHCPKNLLSCFVTDHIWQRTQGREFVISICDNKTLNCWVCKV